MTAGSPLRLQPYGDRAILIETDQPLALRDELTALADPAIEFVVPAARTVLVGFDPDRLDLAAVLGRATDARPARVDSPEAPEPLTLTVRYDGPDLATVADQTGLSVAEVIRRHHEAEYTVAFCGFSPGFGYLTGLPGELRLPRLDRPRTRVPAGSVAIADEYTGVYPRPSPGGWRLLGQTEAELFDHRRNPPALLVPGRLVRFVPA